MEKFFLKVLHEEPVTDLSLQELVGGGCWINVCIKYNADCTCYNDSSYIICADFCSLDSVERCPGDCDGLRPLCPPVTTIGDGEIH